MESHISFAKKKVELITAQINDINEEDIQGEYRVAFDPVRNTLLLLIALYDTEGFTSQTEEIFAKYNLLLANFEQEYEI